MRDGTNECWRVDDLTIDVGSQSVTRAGHPVCLPQLSYRFLLALAREAPRLLSVDDLMKEVWAGVFVNDETVTQRAKLLRDALGDSAKEPRYFAVRRGAGYQLIPPAINIEASGGCPQAAKRVGKLPENDNFGHSPPEAAFHRRWIMGAALASAAAAGGLGLLMPGTPADDSRVQRAAQILRYAVPGTRQRAVSLLRQAVADRPRDGRAWGLLALALAGNADDDPKDQTVSGLAELEDAMRNALRLNPKEPDALLARFNVQGSLRDYWTADQRLRLVLRLDPSNAFAMRALVALLQGAGMSRESWEWNERVIALDPLSPSPQLRKALKHWIFGRVEEADALIDRVMQLWPSHPWVWNARLVIYAFTGRPRAALAMIENDAVRPPTVTGPLLSTWRASLIALERRTPATIAEARSANLEGAKFGAGIAASGVMAMSALGEVDAAFAIAEGVLLSRGSILTLEANDSEQFATRPGWRVTQWLFNPPVAALRADPRFAGLCEDIGLTRYWRLRGIVPDYLAPA